MRHWTEEERERQAALMRQQQLWKKSTGPKTAAGKAKSRMNALRHGVYSAETEAMRACLHKCRKLLAALHQSQ